MAAFPAHLPGHIRAHSDNPEERRRFEAWKENPDCARAYARTAADWTLLNEPRRKGQTGALLARLESGRTVRWRRWLAGLGLAAAAGLAVFVAEPWGGRTEKTPTVAVRPDRQVLLDGSVVELNAGAEIAVDYAGVNRKVKLLRGEALFTVAKNKSRPFVVSAGAVEVTAVGTAFTVRRAEAEVRVLVTEGKVAVAPAGPAAPVFVAAGEQVVVPTAIAATPEPRAVDAVGVAHQLAWRGKRVEFTDTPLAEAVALFNQGNPLRLEVTDPGLAGLRLNGIFWADDPEGFVRLLEEGMGVRAVPVDGGIALRRK